MTRIAIFLLFLPLYSCTEREIISVQVNQDKLVIEDREITKLDFEKELKIIIDIKINEGFKKSELVIHVTADKEIPTIEMSEIEKSIRRSGMSREYFWTE